MKFSSATCLLLLLLVTGCGPTLTMSPGHVAGDYRVTQFTVRPGDAVREQTYGAAAGTVAQVDEFKRNLTPVLTKALAWQGRGTPVNMTIEVTFISSDINKVTAVLVSDSVRVVTKVTLTDPDTQQIIATDVVQAMADSTAGLFGVVSDAVNSKTHEDYQRILVQKYTDQLIGNLFPGPRGAARS